MNKSTDISVVIPVFNSADTIEETLNSVVTQSYTRWEVICVDDGSTDNSIEVISKYIETHPEKQIRIVKREKEEKGGSVCRNLGAKVANGRYLVFLDADDLLAETCLENRVAIMEKKENANFAVFPMAAFKNNNINEIISMSRLHVRNPLYFFITGFGTWQVTSPIIRKSFFDRINGFDITYPRLQDVEFHIRAIVESQGNYTIQRDSPADCYYRKGNTTAVCIEKFKKAIEGSRKLVVLIKHYADQGVFTDKKRFSLALSSLYNHISIYQDSIILHEKSYYRINPIMQSGLKTYIGVIGKFWIEMIDHIPFVKLRLFLCRAVDKIIRSILVR